MWMPLSLPWQAPSADFAPCCQGMGAALAFDCVQHADPFDCADALIVYNEIFDEYGIPVHDGGATYVLITNCPWCGTGLPESQRDRWFDETDALGVSETDLPLSYRTGGWRR
jgi:hypothetical protein